MTSRTELRPVRRIARTLVLAAALPIVAAPRAPADTIDLVFRPPEMAPQEVCIARPPDEETVALWSDWDGGALPDMESDFVRRDLKRLQQIDARRWFGTIDAMIDRLAERDPKFAGRNALLTRIQAMEDAGRYEELRARRLVPDLARMEGSDSPRIQNALSRFYRDGIGVERDNARADELLIAAGYGGNADALLTLSQLAAEGRAPEGWDVPVDLAVTMAFGSLVGELNPTICDRTSRIAREYHNGEVVTHDARLAHDWYRFTADLGDDYAAWKVVEYHMQAEGFEKDNDVLLKYLTQASDGGLSYAQIELGRLYEAGSLVEHDLDRALSLYKAAAAGGGRPGLTRVALFLEEHKAEYAGQQDDRIAALTAISEMNDAPGWVFTRLAQNVLETEGRWAGEARAMALLEEASARGDLDGITRLATMLIARRQSPEEFERAIGMLSRSVSVYGGVTPSKRLAAAFMCQAADSPRLEEAAYWSATEEATASANIEIPVAQLIALTPEQNPREIAIIQSQALYGRPSSLASWLKYLDYAAFADDEMREFWQDYSEQYNDVLNALAKLELQLASNPEQRLAAFDMLRREYQQSGAPAALELAQALLDYDAAGDATTREDILALLREPAEAGIGAAIQLIASLDTDAAHRQTIYEQYAGVIADNGDFDALVFAAPFVQGETRDLYLSRAAGVMRCDYKHAMAMAQLSNTLGDDPEVSHWLDIAEHLTGQNAWAMRGLAEMKMDAGGPDAATEAQTLLEQAVALGDDSASRDLFELALLADQPTYDPEGAVAMIDAAREGDQWEMLASYLSRYRGADDAVKAEIEARLDMPVLYRTAAANGDIYSMRAYGQYLQETAEDADTLAESTDWLRKAAEGGDTTAMAEYGEALAFGIGTQANPAEAVTWLEKAAAGGSRKATEITALIRLSEES